MSHYIFSSLANDEELNFSEEAEVFVFPTSFAQQRLWFLDQLAPVSLSIHSLPSI